jgi:hypothetical protein
MVFLGRGDLMRNDCIQVASFLLAEQDQDKEDGDDKFGEQIRKESEDMPPNLTAEASLKSKPMNNRRFAANSVARDQRHPPPPFT